MSTEQIAFLQTSIADRIKGVDTRRLSYRKKSFRTLTSTSILAAIASILLGLNLGYSEVVRIAVLVITALISVINAYNAFFNYKDLWIANNNALNKLYALKFRIEFAEKNGQPVNAIDIDSYQRDYQLILNELNQVWHQSRQDNTAS